MQDIEYEEFLELTSSNCYYCNAPPTRLRKHRNHTPYPYNGLDKMDPNGGYVKGNIVPCCWRCNRMKSNLTHDAFIEYIYKILKNLKYD